MEYTRRKLILGSVESVYEGHELPSYLANYYKSFNLLFALTDGIRTGLRELAG